MFYQHIIMIGVNVLIISSLDKHVVYIIMYNERKPTCNLYYVYKCQYTCNILYIIFSTV